MDDREACALLERLVAMPSLSTHEAAVAAELVSAMAALGFAAQLDAAGNAVGMIGSGPETVLLLGHMDTVPGAIPVRVEAGVLWGRGAVDAKGALATFVVAAARAARSGALQRRIGVIGCVEEEVASSRGARHIAAHWPAPAWCVVGEPSGAARLTLGYKGNLRLQLRLEQPAAHSAHPTPTAAERGVALWQALAALATTFNAGRQRAFEQLTPALVGCTSGGDGLHDWCELIINTRLPLDCPPERFAGWVRALAASPWTVCASGGTPAFACASSSSLVQRFNRVFRAQGIMPRHVFKTGTADMNIVGPHWGCPVVAYGPGDASLDHTPDERIDLSEYLHAIVLLEAVLLAP